MLKSFIVTYEKGYSAGLQRATALPGERKTFQGADSASDKLTEVVLRPAYREGFRDGFHDGLQVLASLSSARRTLV